MKTIRMRLSLLAALGFLAALAPTARAGYLFETLNVPDSAGWAIAYGINNAGQVVGTAANANYTAHGFLYDGGTYTTLNAPAGVNGTEVYGINNHGDIALAGYDARWTRNGFVLSNGVYSPFAPPAPGISNIQANAINDQGDVVGFGLGYSDDRGYWFQSYLQSSNGVYSPIEVPGAGNVAAWAINNRGDMAGDFSSADGTQQGGFLLSGGVFTQINVPGALLTYIYGMNNTGSLVGSYIDSGWNYRSFVYSGGAFTTFDNLDIRGINDRGDIVGGYSTDQGTFAFVGHATAVPEPSSMTLAVLGFGVAGLAGVRRRRARR